MPKSASPKSSSITLEDLEKLSKSTPKESTTSLTVQTTTPGKELRGTHGQNITSPKTKSALTNFEHAIGGREVLIETLSVSSLDKKQEHFLRILSDPNRATDTLAIITRDADMLPSQVIEMFRHASFAKAHAIAMGTLSEAIPSIVKDIADKSVDAIVVCPDCQGQEVPEGACYTCKGRGQILRTSDLDRQKLSLEIGGLLKKGGGVNVQVNQQVGIVSPNTFFSKYVKQSDNTAYEVNVIDAEKVENNGSKG